MNLASIMLAITVMSFTAPGSDAELIPIKPETYVKKYKDADAEPTTLHPETYVKKYKDDKTKLDPVESAALNTHSSISLANVTTVNGTVVEFIEPEEGFIVAVGTEVANEPIAVENVEAKSTMQTAKTIQATTYSSTSSTIQSSRIEQESFSDPVVMYEALSGTSAPQPLKDANDRRKRYIASRRPPEDVVLLLEEQSQTETQQTTTQSTTSSTALRGSSGGGGADRRHLRMCTDWWERDWCNRPTNNPDSSSSCTCFSCKTGTRIEYVVAENIYLTAHAARGTISQSMQYLSCPADQGQPCAWRALDVQAVTEGEIKFVQGFGNGDLIQWSATLSGEYSGWDWYVSGSNSDDSKRLLCFSSMCIS
jgi:hypothetical protein